LLSSLLQGLQAFYTVENASLLTLQAVIGLFLLFDSGEVASEMFVAALHRGSPNAPAE